jgi:hypothetical protein
VSQEKKLLTAQEYTMLRVLATLMHGFVGLPRLTPGVAYVGCS